MTLRKTEEIFGLILVVNLKPDEKKRKMIFQSVTQAAQRKKSVYPIPSNVFTVTLLVGWCSNGCDGYLQGNALF